MYALYRFADVKNGFGRFWNIGCEAKLAHGFWLRVILSTRGLYPLWLRIVVISAHVEVFAVEVGALRMVHR